MATDANRFDWIRPVRRRGESYPPPEMEAELNAAEKALGSPLPASYRAFARRFGLGGRLHTLPELFRLMPIPGKREPHWSDSVIDAPGYWRSPAAVDGRAAGGLPPAGNRLRVRRGGADLSVPHRRGHRPHRPGVPRLPDPPPLRAGADLRVLRGVAALGS